MHMYIPSIQPYPFFSLLPTGPHCTGCKSKEHNAVARCFDCSNLLCPNCVMAHQFMHCFEGHRVVSLTGDANAPIGSLDEVLLASLAATVNGQLGGGSSSRMQQETSPTANSQSGELLGSGAM